MSVQCVRLNPLKLQYWHRAVLNTLSGEQQSSIGQLAYLHFTTPSMGHTISMATGKHAHRAAFYQQVHFPYPIMVAQDSRTTLYWTHLFGNRPAL